MKLAIADPPYPPRFAGGHRPADYHDAAGEWDAPARHRQLLEGLVQTYDGWAIATTPDGLDHYRPLPIGCETLAWVKPNGLPGGGRIRGTWEAVIVFIPYERRVGRGIVPAHLVTSHLPNGFAGSKPPVWTRWVLDALGYDPETDTVDDLFPGSGAVGDAIAQGVLL